MPATPRPDACPGVLRLHTAADGPLARVRVPGGMLTATQLQALAGTARAAGNGAIELTARGNIQLRGITAPAVLEQRLTAAGLLPSVSHERVRNIVASPLSGRSGGHTDVRALVASLDAGLRAQPALARLPGRILFGIDDGRADVSALDTDISLHANESGTFGLILAGQLYDLALPPARAVPAVLAAATVTGHIAGGPWRLRDIPRGAARVLAALRQPAARPLPAAPATRPEVGWIPQDDGLVSLAAGVRFGALGARLAEFLAAPGVPVTITPWRTIILHDLPEGTADQVLRVLAPLGLIFDANSPWLTVTACTGKPGCASARADVRADAAAAIAAGHARDQHWSGCERRCGRPAGTLTDIVANSAGYAVIPRD